MKPDDETVAPAVKFKMFMHPESSNAWLNRALLVAFVWTAVLAVSVYWNWADLQAMAGPSASKPLITLAATHALVWLTGIVFLAYGYHRLARHLVAFQDWRNHPRGNNQILDTVFENIPAALFWKDRDGVYQHCNQQFVRLRGLSGKDDVIGKSLHEFASAREEADLATGRDQRIMETGQSLINVEETLTRPDGSIEHIVSSKVPLRDSSGEVIGILGIFTDITERKRAETALAASEARFRALIDHSPSAIFLKDQEGRYILINKALEERHDILEEELRGKTVYDHLPPDIAEVVAAQDREVLETRESRVFRHVVPDLNGTPRVVHSVKFPVPGVDEARHAVGCISRDITERVRAEEALKNEHQLLEAVLEAIPHAVYWKDRDLVYAGCNTVFAREWNCSREAIIGKTIHDLGVNEEEATAIEAWDRSVLETGNPLVDFEDTQTQPDGSVAHHLTSKVPLRNPAGAADGVLGVFTDITERKRMEWMLSESEDRLRLLLESTADGIFGINLEGLCTFANPACARMLGYDDPNVLVGEHMHALCHYKRKDGSDYPAWECQTCRAVKERRSIQVDDEVFWRKDGTSFPVAYRANPMTRGSEVRGAVVSFTDITERLEVEDRLRQSQRMRALGHLTGGLAHELNNLLLPILALSQMVRGEVSDEDNSGVKLDKIIQATEQAKDLVEKVTAFGHREEDETTVVELGEAVGDAMLVLRHLIPSSLTVHQRVEADIGKAKASPGDVRSVLVNVITNAVDAIGGDVGELDISLSQTRVDAGAGKALLGLRAGSYAELVVTDTGPGMDAETLQHAFEPFFTTKEVGEGKGLGLSEVHGVAARSGGTATIASTPGEGTRVTVFFPLVQD